jgi:hypothetical protein
MNGHAIVELVFHLGRKATGKGLKEHIWQYDQYIALIRGAHRRCVSNIN